MFKRDYNHPESWYDISKFTNGYYSRIDIFSMTNKPFNYNVVLSIGKKKKIVNGFINETKDSNSEKTNIGSGIEPLIWAKKSIIEFIEMQKERKMPCSIYVWGSDGRRFRVYCWGLEKIGFKKGFFYGKPGLIYKVEV